MGGNVSASLQNVAWHLDQTNSTVFSGHYFWGPRRKTVKGGGYFRRKFLSVQVWGVIHTDYNKMVAKVSWFQRLYS